MKRNLDKRVEVLVPVENGLTGQLRAILDAHTTDRRSAWGHASGRQLRPTSARKRTRRSRGAKKRSSNWRKTRLKGSDSASQAKASHHQIEEPSLAPGEPAKQQVP